MTVLHPVWLFGAAAAALAFLFVRRAMRADDWRLMLSPEVLKYLGHESHAARMRDPVLLALSVVFVALSSPSIRAPAQAFTPGEGVLILADVSRSMMLDDIRPSRMVASRAAITTVLRDAGAKPVALIVYAGDAYLAQPFSLDRGQLLSFVNALEHGTVPREGSDPARAMTLAGSVLRQSAMAAGRIVAISDGGGFGSGTDALARTLVGRGFRLDGVYVAPTAAGSADDPSPDRFEQTVAAGGGVLLRVDAAGTSDVASLSLGASADGFRTAIPLAVSTTDWQNLSHWLLIATLPLFLIAMRRAMS